MNQENKAIFWDYDISKIDLDQSENRIWYLTRKLNFGDFSNIKKDNLKKYLPKLEVDPYLKKLLRNFLKANV